MVRFAYSRLRFKYLILTAMAISAVGSDLTLPNPRSRKLTGMASDVIRNFLRYVLVKKVAIVNSFLKLVVGSFSFCPSKNCCYMVISMLRTTSLFCSRFGRELGCAFNLYSI